MARKENLYRSEASLNETVQAMEWKRNTRRISGSKSFDVSPLNYVKDVPNVYSPQRRQINPVLSSSHSHRNGFSRSMVDLPSARNGFRKSVVFEEDLCAHKEMLQRARNRFKELELKYPEIFKNSRTSSVSSPGSNRHSGSFNRSESLELESVERQNTQTAKTDTLQVLGSGEKDQNSSTAVAISRGRPPPLSVAMKLHFLEDSGDSAFDEIDHDRESMNSKASHEPTPTSFGINKHFLFSGESVESDKDSGISTDRPCTPNSKPVRPVRWPETRLDTQTLSSKSKSLTALSSPRSNSLEYPRSDSDSVRRHRVDRRGILKSVAYRNQEIRAESLDIPAAATSPTHHQGRQNRSGSLSGNIRRGSSIYRRNIFSESRSFSGSQDETDSDAETICSVQSEFILRPHMSARERYFSTYNLNPISESIDQRDIIINQKWRSMPELARSHSLGSVGDSLPAGFDEKKRKKKKRKFGRRSGLYIVNDMPVSEKPRLSVDKGKKSKSKIFSKKSKKHSLHVNELTKKWFDCRTAVSRPTGGQSLGRIIAMRENLGSAYVLELQRSPGGLFGFFIQKGYKQYRKGVFVSRIMDCSSSKFMAGLLNPGDEILEINGESTSSKTMSEVHNVLANSDKLILTVLPILGRKDW